MALALLSEIKRIRKVNHVIVILKIHPNCKSKSLTFLFNTISDLSDLIYIKSDCALKNESIKIFTKKNNNFVIYRESKDIKLSSKILEGSLFLRSHADIDKTSVMIGEAVRSYNNHVYVFLDGCYPPNNSLPIKYFNPKNAIYADKFLLYSKEHKKEIESVGYKGKTINVGYFKMYEAWQNIIKSYTKNNYIKNTNKFTVSIFTRGEDDSQPKDKQLIHDESLLKVLNEIYVSLNEIWGNIIILIKPHPSQNINSIDLIFDENTRIVSEHPSILAEISDLVITTWSTSIVDAIISGVPCLEYFRPTKYFFEVYENGSSFKQLGIPSIKNRKELLKYLRLIKSASYKIPDPRKGLKYKYSLQDILT